MIKSLTVHRLLIYICLSFLLVTCKKEIKKDNLSESGIKYFDGHLTDKVNTISKTTEGGFIYCGYTGNLENHTDAFLMKVDANGNQQWYKTYGGSTYDEFQSVIQTSDGGFLAVGRTNSFGQGLLDTAVALHDYIVKTDANGNIIWSKSFLKNIDALYYAVENAQHEYILSGAAVIAASDILSLKFNDKGDIIWGWAYYPPNIPPKLAVPQNYNDYGRFIGLSNDGDIMIGGIMSKSWLSTEAGKMVPYLMKISNATGKAIWFHPYYSFVSEGSYHYSWDNPHYRRPFVKVCNLSDGYLIGTYIELPGTVLKMQLIKTNLNGDYLWDKEYSGLGNAILHNVEACADSTFLLIGMTTKESFNNSFPEKFPYMKTMLLKVDKEGNEIWTKYIGDENNINSSKCVQPHPDGSWSIAGYTSLTATGYDKMFFIRTDKNGNLIFNK